MDPLELFAVGLVGVAAGAVNTLAGGGSLITLPALIFLGVPAGVANGTNRVGVLFQSLVAAQRFHRAGVLDRGRALPLLVPTCAASTLGALASARIEDERFEQVIGLALLAMGVVILARPRRWLEEAPRRGPRWLSWLVFLAIGLYGGFLQAGVGIFLLAGLVLVGGQELVGANASKSLLVAGFTLPALLVFALEGLIDLPVAAALTAGSVLGAELGARLALARGAPLLRWVLVAVILAAGVKLLRPSSAPSRAGHGLEALHRGVEGAPVVIAVHGRGDAPERFAPLYEPLYGVAHVVLPRGLGPHGRGWTWFPAGAAQDGSPALAIGVIRAAERVALLAEDLAGEGGPPLLTGFSQGGMISFAVAARHPRAIRAALPVGGLLPEGTVFEAREGRLPPVVAFHGEEDPLVPVGAARRSIEVLEEAGWQVELRTYEGVGHTIPEPLRGDYLEAVASRL